MSGGSTGNGYQSGWRIQRERLIERYGKPERLRPSRLGPLLRALGVLESVNPDNVFVCRYPCIESGKAFANANRRIWGHTVYGPFETESGVVAVVDYSRALGELQRAGESA